MKKLILAILVAVAFVATSAQAQYVSIMSGGTLSNAVGTNLNGGAGFYIDCRNQDNVQVLFSHQNMTVLTASNAILRFIRAADASGTRDDSNWVGNITLASYGTTNVQVATNISVAGVPYLKLTSLENTNTVALHHLTNISIGYVVKKIGRDR